MTREYYIKIKNSSGVWFYLHKDGEYINCAWSFDPLLLTQEEVQARAKSIFNEEKFAYGIDIRCVNEPWHK